MVVAITITMMMVVVVVAVVEMALLRRFVFKEAFAKSKRA